MILHKMKYNDEVVVCAVDGSGVGDGERTICGNVYFKSGLGCEDFEPIGNPYGGKLSKVTCPNCLAFIRFVQGLK